jgi:DnaD/phage-associated family protein
MTPFKRHDPSNASVPAALLDSMLTSIEDLGDLQCILRALRTLDKKSEPLSFITIEMLEGDPVLQKLKLATSSIWSAMETATRIGLFEKRVLIKDGQECVVFVLSIPTEVIPSQETVSEDAPVNAGSIRAESPLNIFSLYESTIGMVTPFIADELKESEDAYPAHWIREAFNVAASLNKRNWRYVAAILNRWYAEDQQNGKPRRHIETTDPKRYLAEYAKWRGASFGK